MADSPKQQKGSASGKTASSSSTPKEEGVIARVVSFLRISNSPRFKFRPTNKQLGKVTFKVKWEGTIVLFNKLTDARHFKRLLKKGAPFTEPVIIRTDTTKEGYIVDEREIK